MRFTAAFIMAIASCLCACGAREPSAGDVDPLAQTSEALTNSEQAPFAASNTVHEQGENAHLAPPGAECFGDWIYWPENLEEEAALFVKVKPDQQFEIQFSDFSHVDGSYDVIGHVGYALRLQPKDGSPQIDLSCEDETEITFDDGRSFTLQRGRGNLFEEAKRRGVDLSENDDLVE